MTATLVLIEIDGSIKKLPNILSNKMTMLEGDILSWRNTVYFEFWPKLPSVMEIQHGEGKALIQQGSGNSVPHYTVTIESKNADDLFTLVSMCIAKLNGETNAKVPKTKQSLWHRLRNWLDTQITIADPKLNL